MGSLRNESQCHKPLDSVLFAFYGFLDAAFQFLSVTSIIESLAVQVCTLQRVSRQKLRALPAGVSFQDMTGTTGVSWNHKQTDNEGNSSLKEKRFVPGRIHLRPTTENNQNAFIGNIWMSCISVSSDTSITKDVHHVGVPKLNFCKHLVYNITAYLPIWEIVRPFLLCGQTNSAYIDINFTTLKNVK